jgi:Tfp pilus assembly protein PilX
MMARIPFRTRQAGIALPVMMIMLTVMMLSSIYLLRASNSSTLTATNLAYDSSLAKAADLGLHTAFQFLSTTPKTALLADVPASGYVSTIAPTQPVNSAAFWAGSTSVTDTVTPVPNRIEYVIHRMCMLPGAYNSVAPANNCTLTAAKPKVASSGKLGESQASDTPVYDGMPELHYVVTARIYGARGGNVITQAVVMMGP